VQIRTIENWVDIQEYKDQRRQKVTSFVRKYIWRFPDCQTCSTGSNTQPVTLAAMRLRVWRAAVYACLCCGRNWSNADFLKSMQIRTRQLHVDRMWVNICFYNMHCRMFHIHSKHLLCLFEFACSFRNLTFMEPCIASYIFYITNEMQFIQCSLLLLSALYMFRAVFPPLIRSL